MTDKVQLEILQLLKQMQQDMKCTPTAPPHQKKGKKTPDDASFPRKKTDKYCWTHGGCWHLSPKCEAKAPGHQDAATFDNCMDRSNAYCQWRFERAQDSDLAGKLGKALSTSQPLISPIPSSTIIAKGDSGATNHYWKQVDCQVLINIQHIPGPSVHQPNNTALASTGTGQLPLSTSLSPTGKQAMIIPALKSASLISLGQLCDNNCQIVLT